MGTWEALDYTVAYWCGWLDSCYGEPRYFTDNRRLTEWPEPCDRLDYYRGHRACHEARLRKAQARAQARRTVLAV